MRGRSDATGRPSVLDSFEAVRIVKLFKNHLGRAFASSMMDWLTHTPVPVTEREAEISMPLSFEADLMLVLLAFLHPSAYSNYNRL